MDNDTRDSLRRAALARRDYVLWLARALEQRSHRAKLAKLGSCGYRQPWTDYDIDLDQTVAQELRALVE